MIQVVNHHGKLAAGGHYTCDVYSERGWLRFDDDRFECIEKEAVLEEKNDRQSYMLFYVEVENNYKGLRV